MIAMFVLLTWEKLGSKYYFQTKQHASGGQYFVIQSLWEESCESLAVIFHLTWQEGQNHTLCWGDVLGKPVIPGWGFFLLNLIMSFVSKCKHAQNSVHFWYGMAMQQAWTHLTNAGLTGITGAWWDNSYDSTEMQGYRIFRKDRKRRQVGSVTLHISDQLHLGMDEELTESLWVRINERAGIGAITVGVATAAQPGKLSMRFSADRLEQLHIHFPHPHGGFQPLPRSVRGTTQQGAGNPRNSWNAFGN